MDAELRRSPNARKLFREIVPVDPPEIGCENRDATATYTYIIGELVAFVGLWRRRGARGVAWLGDSRHLNANGVGELVIESADLSYYFNHYGVSKAAVERTRHLIARGDEPIVAQLRLPAVRE